MLPDPLKIMAKRSSACPFYVSGATTLLLTGSDFQNLGAARNASKGR
jgi:hypothetical protein